MKKIAIILALFTTLFLFGCNNNKADISENKPSHYRIISLAPSITNIIFALGKGDELVGVTRYCKYPSKRKIPTVGGYMDFNAEAMISLDPNIVFLAPEHTEAKKALDNTHIKYVEVKIDSFDDITKTIKIIGDTLNATEKANELINTFNTEIANIEKRKPARSPKVMVCLDRKYNTKELGKIYITGKSGIYARAISVAGGKNAYNIDKIETPIISSEGVMKLNPDIIIDVVPDYNNEFTYTEKQIKDDWNAFPSVNAVKNNRLYVLSGTEISVPDQNFYKVVLKLEKIIKQK